MMNSSYTKKNVPRRAELDAKPAGQGTIFLNYNVDNTSLHTQLSQVRQTTKQSKFAPNHRGNPRSQTKSQVQTKHIDRRFLESIFSIRYLLPQRFISFFG
jgi:hypothetical protein